MSRADEFSDSLPGIALSLTERREQRYVIDQAVDGLVERFGASLARIWIAGKPGRSRYRTLGLGRELCLRLKAESTSDVDLAAESGREVMVAPWIVKVAESRECLLIRDIPSESDAPDADWLAENRFIAFCGYPLESEGQLIGVLGVFTRHEMTDRACELLEVFAAQLAAALRDSPNGSLIRERRGLVAIPESSTLDDAMRLFIQHALRLSGGRIEGRNGAAEALKIHPNTLRSRMAKLGVERH